MISFENIGKIYKTAFGDKHALKQFNLDLPMHGNLGVLGPNGAGKTTFIKLLSGVEKPSTGRVKTDLNISWPIGFSGALSSILSAEESCRFVARLYNEDVDKIVNYTYDFANIGNHFFLPVQTYSAGMRAKVAFGLSMAIDFDVYLVDEIMAVGDVGFHKKCDAVFREKYEKSRIIIVSHNMEEIRKLCAQILLIINGQPKLFDDVEEAIGIYENL